MPRWTGAYAVREEAVPVVKDGRAIAVLGRETNLGEARTPGRLEINYIEAADEMCAMISCPFSSSTRNIALDNASLIIPSCSIEACLAIYYIDFSYVFCILKA